MGRVFLGEKKPLRGAHSAKRTCGGAGEDKNGQKHTLGARDMSQNSWDVFFWSKKSSCGMLLHAKSLDSSQKSWDVFFWEKKAPAGMMVPAKSLSSQIIRICLLENKNLSS